MYQSFFDLSYESLPTQFADYFPPNEPLHIWLRGTRPIGPVSGVRWREAWAADLAAAPQALVFGTVENITTLPLHLEKLCANRTLPGGRRRRDLPGLAANLSARIANYGDHGHRRCFAALSGGLSPARTG
ncbi:MAG: hypothetical protein M5U34_05355 [Chloroflexi bacterium]|nr:hypothetical protein [Chloroflexota bacterium]